MKKALFLFSLISTSTLFAQLPYKHYPTYSFEEIATPEAPDYSNDEHWAALPTTNDFADETPAGLEEKQATAKADVFFVHPTMYSGEKPHETNWNGDLSDEALNQKCDESTIKYQASVFNEAGRIYAPRYRQGHLHVYYGNQKVDAKKALDLAYQDVKRAFEYYLKHYNEGRPIIIASHSQGTTHTTRLVKEFFDGTPLQKQFVVGYLIGMPVEKNTFETIKACESPEETNCFCSWRTFADGYYPPWYQKDESHVAVTNPLSWTTSDEFVANTKNEGGVLRKFDKIRPGVVGARVHKGLLWIDRLRVPGARIVNMKNLHVADINLFYINIRKNVLLRLQQFLNK